MVDLASWVLRVVYFYGHLIGVSNFEFDWRTGRVFAPKWTTFYAIAINSTMFILYSYHWIGITNMMNLFFGKANKLHEYVVIIMTGIKIVAGLVTVLNRWRQRCQMMDLARNVIQLFLNCPQLKKISRLGVLVKFFTGVVTDFLQVIITLDAMGRVDPQYYLGISLQYWMSAILNLATSQHYLIVLFIRSHYQILNIELRQVIEESKELSRNPPGQGVFMTRCCFLADQLEDIAKIQSQLQSIMNQLEQVFGLQGMMVQSGYYMSMVATAYLTYSVLRNGYEAMQMTFRGLILTSAWCFFYYFDVMLNLVVMLFVLDEHKKLLLLLEERTLFAPGLDVRLEQSFESFQLQVTHNPLKIDVVKMYEINRSSSMSMFASFIMHSIYLIQYDLENF
uniref:Gustatory receptor n=1 Tax=Drosophila rhopaloa TaxID=1041015 RepID=A0A6P4FBQ8_DRORH